MTDDDSTELTVDVYIVDSDERDEDECCVCYNSTDHMTECNHHMCPSCYTSICKTNMTIHPRCPICRRWCTHLKRALYIPQFVYESYIGN